MNGIHKRLESWFTALAAFVYDHKYQTLFVVLLAGGLLSGPAVNITVDTRDESFFSEDDPALLTYNAFRNTFGQDDLFIVAMKPKDGLTVEFFKVLREIHADLEAQVPYLEEVSSLANARIVRAEGDTLIVDELMKNPPETDGDVARLLALIDRYPLYENLLVSRGRSVTSIQVKARAIKATVEQDLFSGFDETLSSGDRDRYLSNEENVEIDRAIREVIAKYQDQDIDFYLAGSPAVVAELNKYIIKDIMTTAPLCTLAVILFLFLIFRRVSGVVYPLATVYFALFSTLGIMAMTGVAINSINTIIITFLLVVGLGDSVHVLTIFYRHYAKTGDKRDSIINAVGFAGLPVLMTSATTACGLLSFALIDDMVVVAQLGYIIPAGVMLAFFYSVILIPTLIAIFPIKEVKAGQANHIPFADRVFRQIAKTTTGRPIMVVTVFTVLLVGVLYAATSARLSHNALNWFPTTNSIRIAAEFLDSIYGGTLTLEVIIDTEEDYGLYDPDIQHRLSEAAISLPTMNVQGIQAAKAWSIAEVLKETNRALNEDLDEAYTVPAQRDLIAQELILFEESGSNDLEFLVDTSYRTARLSILVPTKDAILYKDYLNRTEEYLKKQFPDASITITGKVALFLQILKHLIVTMVKSYGFALVTITFLMVFMVGNLRIGLMSMVANVVPVIGVFGLMGLLTIHLDLSTVIVGSIVLGLVVDDTIHFLHHFRRAYSETHNVEEAVFETLSTTGRALVTTSIVLCANFFLSMSSYLVSMNNFGLLTGSAVIFALVADFFLVPAFLALVHRKTILGLNFDIENDGTPLPHALKPTLEKDNENSII